MQKHKRFSILLISIILISIFLTGCGAQTVKFSVTVPESFEKSTEGTNGKQTTYVNQFDSAIVISNVNLAYTDISAAKAEVIKDMETNYPDAHQIVDAEAITVAGCEGQVYDLVLTMNGLSTRGRHVLVRNYLDGFTLIQFLSPEENFPYDVSGFDAFLESLKFLPE